MIMKKIAMIWSMTIILVVATACGTTNEVEEATGACENPLVPVEVDLTWEPSELNASEEIQFKAEVTHDGYPVLEAQEVNFEIWEHNNPDYHHMLETSHEGNGVYSLDWTFETEGIYYIYYHVTACDMHRMEKSMLVVGEVNTEELLAEPDTVQSKMDGHGDHSEHSEHGDGHGEEEQKHNH